MGRKKILAKVRNYKELCEFFGVEPKAGGRNRELQLLSLERYGDFKKDSGKNSYTIYSRYEKLIPKTSTRGFQSYIQDLLVDMVAREKGTIEMTMNQLLLALGMVNENYANAKSDVPNFSKIMDIPENEVYDWFYGEHGVNSNLSNKVVYGLDKLRESSWLIYYKRMNLCKFNTVYDTTNKTIKKDYYFEVATDEEQKYVLKAEREAYEEILNELKIDDTNIRKKIDKQWLYIHHKFNLWRQKVREILNLKNIEYAITVYRILGNEEDLEVYKSYDDKILSKKDKALYYTELNNSLLESLEKSFETKHNKAKEECDLEGAWGEIDTIIDFSYVDKNTKLRAKDGYLNNTNKITKKLVDITTEYDVRLEKNK